MRLEKLQYFEKVIPDLRHTGTERVGTCPNCGRPTLRLVSHKQGEFEPSCVNCSPGQIRDAIRVALGAGRSPKNGAGPALEPPHRPVGRPRHEPPSIQIRQPKGITADVLVEKEFNEIRWAVPDMIGEGITVFAGGTKTGKSWFALMIGIAVASGGRMLGQIKVDEGDVLYLALEDNERRLKSRLLALLKDAPAPARLHLYTEWPTLAEDALGALEKWLEEHPGTRLVMVDVLQKIRAPRGKGAEPYEEDYRVLGSLKKLADERSISILVLHHTRKLVAADPFDMIAGSVAMSGVPDGVMVLMRQRDEPEATLHFIGRDVISDALALRWDEAITTWNLLGKAEEHRKSAERQEIFDTLKSAEQPMSPVEVAGHLDRKPANVKVLMWKMTREGEIVASGRGRYRVPGSDQAPQERRGEIL